MSHHCDPVVLQPFVTEIFERLGADPDVAVEVARHLVRANLPGHDSHGIIRVAQYAGQAERGVPPAQGVERILAPRELEAITREQRARDGREIPDPVWRDLTGIAGRFGVEVPAD